MQAQRDSSPSIYSNCEVPLLRSRCFALYSFT